MEVDLHTAVLEEQIDTVSDLINKKVNVNQVFTMRNYNLLHLAVESNNFDIAKLLINAGVNTNHKNRDGYTPLHVAVMSNNIEISKLLVEAGADLNSANEGEDTPVEMAIKSRNINILKLFVSKIADVNAKDETGCALIHHAVDWGNSNVVKLLLDACANFDLKNDSKNTPLHEAIHSGNICIVKVLVDAGADLYVEGEYGIPPLHCAAQVSETENILKFLLKAGVDVKVDSSDGDTILHEAISNGNLDVLNLLIQAGADVNKRNSSGATAFTHLIDSVDDDVDNERYKRYFADVRQNLKLLIEYTNVNLTDANNRNLLSILLESQKVSGTDFFYKIVLEHIAKLKSSNPRMNSTDFQVDLKLLDTISRLPHHNRYFTECIQELEKAKTTKLYNCWVTFFNLLVDEESKFVKYAGNMNLVNDCNNRVNDFLIYGSVMRSNVNKGVKRRKLFDEATNILSDYLPIFDPTHLIIKNTLEALNADDWKKLSMLNVELNKRKK